VNKKLIAGAGIFVAIVVAVAAGAVLMRPKPAASGNNPKETKPPISSSRQSISGTVVCAPKKPAKETTLECAYGITTALGKSYLINIEGLQSGGPVQQYSIGTNITVEGTVSEPSSSLQHYDIVGVIAAVEIRQQ
jgi:hypothetical protein